MKHILMLVAIFATLTVFGQTPDNKTNEPVIAPKQLMATDATIKVVYANETPATQSPAWFINGKFVDYSLSGVLNTVYIENITVVKGIVRLGDTQYDGRIYIETKGSYNPKLISLTDLKNKYTNLKNKSVLFMIDENFVNTDYDQCMVDESYVLQIVVDNIKNEKENIDLGLIKILTKSDENIKKSKEIRLRGNAVAMN